MFTFSQAAIIGLIFIAGTVSYLQVKKKNAWYWIIAYWVLLTIKNLFDLLKI